ncbi:MAG: FprA family A-type flavoprotein [Desulfocucumaceae bacterium]
MKAVPIRQGIYWVGALDPDLRVFDILMKTDFGTTYNAYLVKGEKSALVDAVKSGYKDELLSRVASVLPPEKIDYIVVNHTEPDHSGAMGALLEKMPQATVIASGTAVRFLREMINRDFPHIVVKDGDRVDLGGKTLDFISAPFLHWPDTIFTYVPEDQALFTCDAFGRHFCSREIFNDLAGDSEDAYRYYYDVIMSPFAGYVLDAVNRIGLLDFDLIAPSHGPVLRDNPRLWVEKYAQWSAGSRTGSNSSRKKVVIAFVSAHGNTRKLAVEIAAGVMEAGAEARVVDMQSFSPADTAMLVSQSDGLLVGSPTINRDAVYPVWELLGHLSPIVNRGKPAAAFGSYGWSGEAVKMIEQRLSGLQFKISLPSCRVNFSPTPGDLTGARELGRSFAGLLDDK